MRNIFSTGRLIFLTMCIAALWPTVLSQGNGIEFTPADEAVLREMVRQYYYAYETPDLEPQLAQWSAKSTDPSSKREAAVRRHAAFEQMKVEKLSVDRVVASGETVRVRITVNVKAILKRTGKPVGGWMNSDAELTHLFVKEGTAWKLIEIKGTAEDLVEEIGALATDQQRRKAIEADPEVFLKREFINEFSAYGLTYGERSADYKTGVEILRLSMELAKKLGDVGMESQVSAFLGSAYMYLGDHGLALYYDNRHYELELLDGESGNPSNALNSLGGAYSALGDPDRAMEHYERSLALRRGRSGSQPRISLAWGNLASSALEKGDLVRAKKEFEAIVELARKYDAETTVEALKREHKTAIAKAQQGLSRVALAEGNFQRAIELHQEAWEFYKTGRDKGMPQFMLKTRAEIELQMGDFPSAFAHSSEAADLAIKMGVPDLAWDAYLTAARASIGMGKRAEARAELEKSIAIIEAMRTKVLGGEDVVQRFFDSKSAPYAELANLLLLEGKVDEAFKVSEQIKGRTLLSVLSGGLVRFGGGLTELEREQERGFRIRLAEINQGIRNEQDVAKLAALKSKLETVRKEHMLFRNQLYAVHPELRAREVEFPEVTRASLSANLDVRTAVVSYVIANDQILIFAGGKAVDKAGFSSASARIGQADLTRKVAAFRENIGAGDLDFQKASRELYDLLIKPVAKDLVGKTNVIIVPDGALWDLPFQALMDEKGKYLIEKAAVSYAPSLTALKEMSAKAKQRKAADRMELFAFGNPIVGEPTKQRVQRVFMSEKLDPLPEAERLVNELGRMYEGRSKVLTGIEAQEEMAKSEAPKYRIVQMATHGILNNSSPMYSHLVLAQPTKESGEDGLLEAWELKDMNLNADMLILSACETGRGKVSRGEGMIGMTWAAFIAGVPTTVASQWKVESRSTTELMLEFHRQLLNKKVSKAEAMRQAALKIKRTREFSHPSYWAGFVVVGDAN